MYDGRGGKAQRLWTAKEYGDCEVIADWKLPAAKKGEPASEAECGLNFGGEKGNTLSMSSDGKLSLLPTSSDPGATAVFVKNLDAAKLLGKWNRFRVTLKGGRLTVHLNGEPAVTDWQVRGGTTKGPISLFGQGGPAEFTNVFARELKE